MSDAASINFQSGYASALPESMNAAVITTDADFIIQHWNQYAETIFEYKAGDVTGKRRTSVLKFDYLQNNEAAAQSRLIAEGRWKGRILFRQKSGKEILLDASVSTVKNFKEEITGYVEVYTDITEFSKNNLTALVSAFSNIDDNFFIVDENLRIAFIDEKSKQNLCAYYGIRYNVGDLIADKLPGERKHLVEESFKKALQGIKTSDEVNIKNVIGKSIWLHESYFPVKEFDGSVSHACLMLRDITLQKQIEQINEELYQSRKLFETFMENSPILSWITDSNGENIHYLNPAYLKTYHLKKEDIGKPASEALLKTIAQQTCENDVLVCQTNQPIKTIEKNSTPDKKEHVYQVIKFPIVSDGQTYVGGWAIDITEEIQLRENLKISFDRLQQSENDLKEALIKEHQLNNLKSSFVSMASHEFRTPLSTMLSSTFLLEKYTAAQQQPHRIKHIYKIKESIHHMNALLEDFLSLGKLDEGKTIMTPSHFDLSELIRDVIEEVEPVRREGQTIYFKPNSLKEIYTDKKLLRNIIINLLSNACKFSDENKRVWISSRKLAKEINITIKDEGIGICEEDQKHLFETFFRGRNVQNIQGTGMGLHIIKRYAELLHGHVELKSELEKGTTVSISLPLEY